MSTPTEAAGTTFTPAPGAAPVIRQIRAQSALELRLLLRHGEQFVLTLVLPVLLLVAFATVIPANLAPDGVTPVDWLTPGVIALAILSTAFTGQAISTGFDRRYGVLKRLGSTPLSHTSLLAAKILTVLVLEALQVVVLVGVAVALGWSPALTGAALGGTVLALLLGTSAFCALGLLMAGALRAEATLALANLLYVLLLVTGDVFLPLSRFPESAQQVLALNPLAALTDALRDALTMGSFPAASSLAILAAWTAVAGAAAVATFSWD